MVSRRAWIALACAGALGHSRVACAEAPPKRAIRVAFLGAATAQGYAPQLEALRRGLRDYGYVEGVNLALLTRWADGNYERLRELATQLVALKPDVIVTHATPGTRAAMAATSTIPIVMATNGDAVAQGLVATLPQPGGNVTGSTFLQPQLMAKRIELMQLAVPQGNRIAVLLNPANPTRDSLLHEMRPYVEPLRVTLVPIDAEGADTLPKAIADAVRARVDGMVVRDDARYIAAAADLARIALAHNLPIAGFCELADRGGLIGYGPDFKALFRRVGYFVDRIVRGEAPAMLPVEQARKFELVLNLKTARAMRLTLPRTLLLRADRVVDSQ
jgi:putative ABC transport system substrate-binding protein